MKTVYIDTLLLVNMLTDYVIVHMTARFLLIKTSIKREAMSAFIGALCSLFFEVLVNNRLLVVILSLFTFFAMSLAAFGKSKLKFVIRQIVVMYIFSYILCGMVSLVLAIFYPNYYSDIKTIIILLCAVCFAWLSKKISPFFRNRIYSEQIIAQVVLNDSVLQLKLLCDSGNVLIDNVSGLPVIVTNVKKDEKSKAYPIFVNTVSGNKMLWCNVPEKISIKHNNEYREIRCCVAYAEGEFCGCDGIIPSALIENL